MEGTNTSQGLPVDESRRRLLQGIILLAGLSVTVGLLRGLEFLMPPIESISEFPKLLLVDENGNPIKASDIPVNAQPKIAMFNYPLSNEPVFLLNLGDENNNPVAVPPVKVTVPQTGATYTFPGGVGPHKSIVAYSAICQHAGCTFPEMTFYPPGRKAITIKGPMDRVLHCNCHGSTYDPYKGGAVITGPAVAPLPAVILQWDPSTDQLYAVGMIGPVVFGHPGFTNPTQEVVNNPVGDLQGGTPIKGTQTVVNFYQNPALG
ncbi:Rieske 2Fe-2S domain-containing protein [Thermoproteus tenax]|uniref:Rieske iron-sulfur protein n=1 Tax=Thermoproteus tenax (strain ATCC 35583 / DSM 2078 / JCM 9277 / NBRC 100435 / Kra 1) TaxID=768679 RepID=G4RN52_THETK|nr:Rieske 2Fe-2S domain-containing protein [Thermoproteus tenax]CCC80996.1 Rieske iron-sulfur protein [Thermoproteus tenax Kra 1]